MQKSGTGVCIKAQVSYYYLVVFYIMVTRCRLRSGMSFISKLRDRFKGSHIFAPFNQSAQDFNVCVSNSTNKLLDVELNLKEIQNVLP